MYLFKITILFFTVVLLAVPDAGRAATVAVFPVEDLSQGSNGVNFEFSDFISRSLEEKGQDIVPMDQLKSFMARKRIRRLGFLDSGTMHELSEVLGAQYVVFATISQLKEHTLPTLGLIVQILRTADGELIWSKSHGLSASDSRRVLAVTEPKTVDDLWPYIARELFAGFSFDQLGDTDHEPGEVLIEKVEITPRHARPGTEVTCTITLSRKDGQQSPFNCLLVVGDDDYYKMTPYLKAGLRTSWLASDQDGTKPVSLIIGFTAASKKMYLGSYEVDSSAPELDLRLKGVEIGKSILFSKTLPIIPIWYKREPLSRWKISIIKKGGEAVLVHEGTGALPSRFDWRGQRKDGNKAEQGTYLVHLEVWDRAANQTSVTSEVQYRRDTPQPKVQAAVDGDKFIVSLGYQGDIPVKWWSANILFSDGEPLAEEQGDLFPAEITLPVLNQDEKRAVECIVEYRDVLGNRGRKKIADLRQLLIGELLDSQEEIIQDDWLDSF